ncbi:DUF2510 domain-containing protein [Microterricola pindariensis]|nr:DUF2510 domain-containing protein [Microterricola pindariensis]
METPTAGWYPDPADATALRWWDGLGWTEYAKPGALAAPTAPAAPLAPAVPAPQQFPQYSSMPASYATAPGTLREQTIVYPPAKLSRTEADRAVRRNNGFGYAGLALALFGLIFNPLAIPSVLGIIFGSMGLVRARALEGQGVTKQTGLGFSIAALILGILGLIRQITVLAAALMGSGA